jgi:ammonia channel protein AmtB
LPQSPALGFFYAGLARAKNALSLMYLTVMSVAVVSFQVNINMGMFTAIILIFFLSAYSGT